MKLEDRIYNVEYYVKKFNSWDVKEIIIDDQKAFWEIRKPGSQIQKVCLFRDGSNMYIYGEYGSYSFDKMTWLGSPYNLEYNNLGYQNKKMSYDTKNNVYMFDDLIELLEFSMELYENSNDEIEYISYLRNSNLEAFDEVCESQLWRAGKRISQNYLVSLLALKICSEKLKCQRDDENVK